MKRIITEEKNTKYMDTTHYITGFDLTTRHDSYFTNQIEVFTKHILVENTYFTNHRQ